MSRIKLLITNQATGESHSGKFDEEIIKIGRHKDNDIVLPEKGISKFHCQIVPHQAGWELFMKPSRQN